MPMLASAAPEILIAEIAAVTEHIRVGSGGVMLPHYSPLKVAETFSILGGLHGDRVDLGIGRAPGSDRETMFALQRDRRQMSPDDFPEQIDRAAGLLRGRLPGRPPVRAARGAAGRAGKARRLAARLVAAERDLGRRSSGCRTRSPTSSTRAAPRTPASTASASSPRSAAREPELAVCVSAICADTDEEAQRLASSQRMAITLLRRGRLIAVPPVETALAFLEQPGEAHGGRGPARRRRHAGGRPRRAGGGRRRVRGRRADDRDDHVRPRRAPPLVRADRRGVRAERLDSLGRPDVDLDRIRERVTARRGRGRSHGVLTLLGAPESEPARRIRSRR